MNIQLDPADLAPIIQATITATLDRIDAAHAMLPVGRLAIHEPEAAAIIGVAPHALRDARLRGEISGCRIGKRVCYERGELVRFLAERRENHG